MGEIYFAINVPLSLSQNFKVPKLCYFHVSFQVILFFMLVKDIFSFVSIFC